MCGRFTLFALRREIEDRFDATFDYPFERRYNAAPSQFLPVITDENPHTIQAFQWGLVPPWADDRSDGGMINARAETLAEKSSFREAFAGFGGASGQGESATDEAAGRCLVLADGFYEWTETDQGKRPFRVTRVDGEPFAMAGLWTRWRPPDTQTGLGEFAGDTDPEEEPDLVETFAIVTSEPNDVVADLHDRMAVILPEGRERRWLDPESDTRDLLAPIDAAEVRAYQVSRAVNDPSNDRPELVEEVEASG